MEEVHLDKDKRIKILNQINSFLNTYEDKIEGSSLSKFLLNVREVQE